MSDRTEIAKNIGLAQKARAFLADEANWLTDGNTANAAGQKCLLGAAHDIKQMLDLNAHRHPEKHAEANSFARFMGFQNYWELTDWNDSHATHAELLARLDKAIAEGGIRHE
jgi:hypothetical protein